MKKYIYIIIGLLVVVGIVFVIVSPGKSGKYDDFAKCLGEKGAVFYGAFWCTHCQAQKTSFGQSAEHLPYVECSTADGQGQTQVCKDAGVTSYPTWQFGTSSADRLIGELDFATLAKKTSCVLPQ
jgi:thiol-disulfide isomerase/thioredoxin